MEVQQLFPTHLAMSKADDFETLNQQLLQDIEQIEANVPNHKPDGWACNLYTTFPHQANLHRTHPGFRRLGEVFTSHTAEFGAFLGVDLEQVVPVVTECWLNVYRKAESQEVHNHGGYHMSGVYYVTAPPECGSISFYSPLMEEQFFPLPCVKQSWKTVPMQSVQPAPGMLLLFRSWLRHAARPNDIDERRISISFNAVFVPRESVHAAS